MKNVAPLVPALVRAGRISPNAAASLAKLQGVNKETVLTHLQDKMHGFWLECRFSVRV